MPEISPALIRALQTIIFFFGAYLAALWLGVVVWTFRDIRSRSRDIVVQALSTLLVLIFNLPGLLLYFVLRPQETLAEQYERSLEEEALLQDIEDRETNYCPNCKHPIEADFVLCPSCRTRLREPCTNCGRLLHPHWDVCPYCAEEVRRPRELAETAAASGHSTARKRGSRALAAEP